jgi:hypothetical protein
MLALAETAASHEVPLLRDALWKHHHRQTSLKVEIPVSDRIRIYTGSWLDAYFSRPKDTKSSNWSFI